MYDVVESVLLALIVGWALLIVLFAWVAYATRDMLPIRRDNDGIGGA